MKKHLNKTFINKLVAENRLLCLLYERVVSCPHFDEKLYAILENYSMAYIAERSDLYGASYEIYFNYIRSYNKDMKIFVETGKYPLELDANRASLSRYEYDIILLFSCLFSEHRFRIMQLINEQSIIANCGLFIGCGPGLEIELVKNSIQKLYAFDLSINDFLLTKHPTVHFKEAYFTGEDENLRYDSIYLIELLVHLLVKNIKFLFDFNLINLNHKLYFQLFYNLLIQ